MKLSIFRPQSNGLRGLVISVLLAGAAWVVPAGSQAQAATRARAEEQVTLNFSNAEIEAVARTMASITGYNVVVDPRVKGTITLVTEKPVSRSVAMNQFLAVLRLQGFTMVESAGLYKVVPEADAKLQSAAVTVIESGAGTAAPGGNQIVTQIFKLNFESANSLVTVLRPLISPNNTINVNPGTNSLVITDYADNLRRLAQIIAAMDVANATEVEVLPLKHAIATDLGPLVLRLIESSGLSAPGQADTSYRTTLVAEPRSNTLILRAANPARAALVKSLVAKLDQPTGSAANGAAGNIYVVYLKNADAVKLAATLRAAMTGQSQSPAAAAPAVAGAAATAGAAAATQSATGGQVQADAATNSLIITAPEPQYRQLRAVIDRLDGRRAQVLVESLIVEVNTDKAAEFGIQWQGAVGSSGSSNIGLLGTNFTTNNIINLAMKAGTDAPSAPGTGINLGVAHKTNGVYVLGFLANFLETSNSGNVLSTPNLLTLDNEEAKIVIGENVPFVTGSYTSNNSSSGSVNPFTTVERKDVGLTLKVRPQINENGTIKLVIYQETSAVKAGTEKDANGPTTTKRTIESSVLVEDGSIVVLGGLLQDSYSGNQEKVPGLGDIPLFGNLFKSESRGRTKTNLMVFLRPVVMRDGQATDRLSMDRYELMKAGIKEVQPVPSSILPINTVPQLPALPMVSPSPPPALAPAAPKQP
jgi:general secretion pathway protein D